MNGKKPSEWMLRFKQQIVFVVRTASEKHFGRVTLRYVAHTSYQKQKIFLIKILKLNISFKFLKLRRCFKNPSTKIEDQILILLAKAFRLVD